MQHYVCIDIGGTAIKCGIINENGEFLAKGQRETEAMKGGTSILAKAVQIVEDYREQYKLSGICISTAGMVDVETGEIFYSAPLIPGYKGINFKTSLEERFGIPCEVENDVNCAGLAEYISGAARGSRIVLCLTVGTGIGGCILIDGKVFRGSSGSASEVGYMQMEDSDFQTLGAASILCRKVAECKKEQLQDWTGYRVFEAAHKGDAVCIQAINEMTDILGKGIANICYVLNPGTVVIGGGIMAQEKVLMPKIQAALEKYLIPEICAKTRLKTAEYGNDAGMLGAFYHFKTIRNQNAEQ
ncbi:ROK family protein [Roseburia hominis]